MSELENLQKQYAQIVMENLNLDMTRGKPSPEQLDLSLPMVDILTRSDLTNGLDYRNYSVPALLTGIPEARSLFALVLGISKDEVIVAGNSSLNLMYDTMLRTLLYPLVGANKAWSGQVGNEKNRTIKFLCPVPGYDRHFSICESMGIEMINIPLLGDGPDMDLVEKLVKNDPSIKGIWCVPKYSNPTGETYSDKVVERLASMDTAADDFRIFWDNAYVVHHLESKHDSLANIIELCKKYNHPNRVFMFASTSKVTFAGAGISAFASSEENINWFKKYMSVQTIGYDKINQLRHVKFLKSKQGLDALMEKHADILKPKFDMVDKMLTELLGNDGKYASWVKPNGGYFISFNTQPGLADKVVKMALDAGVKLTKAGATFPYGKDPKNNNIRIAPSLPSIPEIKKAMVVLATVTKLLTLQNQSV